MLDSASPGLTLESTEPGGAQWTIFSVGSVLRPGNFEVQRTFPDPDTIPFAIEPNAGTDTLVLDDTGTVGIGTRDPVTTFLAGSPTGLSTILADVRGWINLPRDAGITAEHPSQGGRPVLWTDLDGTYLQSWDSDSTDGIHFRSSDGTQRMFIQENGRVGIGTTGPLAKLHVSGTSTDISGNGGSNIMFGDQDLVKNEIGFFSASTTANRVFHKVATDNAGNNTVVMMLTGTGRAGIGTTTGLGTIDPVADLHVGGQEAPSSTTGTVARLAIQPFGHTGGPWVFNARDVGANAFLDLRYGALSTALTVKHSNGNVGIGSTDPQRALHIFSNPAAPQVRLADGGGSFDLFAGANFHIQEDAGIDRIFIQGGGNTGKVLIDTTNTTLSSGHLYVGEGHVVTTNPDAGFVTTKATGGLGAGMDPEGTRLRWFDVNGTERMSLNTSGNLTVVSLTQTSDARLKTDVKAITSPLEKVLALRGVSFIRTTDDTQKTQVGLIAQEVEQVLPEVVLTGHDGHKAVAYGNIVGVLVEAIKELEARVAELEAQ